MILVTGGAGYIGSHFVKHWLAKNRGKRILVVDNLDQGHQEALAFSNRILFAQEDIGNREAMSALMTAHEVTSVVHFAASIAVGESQKQPHKYMLNNVANSIQLFSAMQDCNVKQIVFSSTCATYGKPEYMPIDESHPQNPQSVYGLSKLFIERTLETYCRQAGWQATCLRYFNAAGADNDAVIGEAHSDETHLIPRALAATQGNGQYLEIFGDDYFTEDGTCIRDYVHVNDLASAHTTALKHLDTQGGFEAYNLGTAHGASVKEVIDICQRITGREITTKICPRRDGDVPVLLACTRKAEAELEWKPTYSLLQIIESAWKWEEKGRFGKTSFSVPQSGVPTNVVSLSDWR
jgi:UDP-glucose-4-epimerase GalE